MRNYVIINGTNSLTIPGLAIKDLPPISKTLMRNQKETIDGRDGDIITELGYSAYDKALTIGLYGSYDINDIIAFFNQKGTIVFSDEPDKYYNFTILDQIDYDKLVKFRTATIRIHCQPFKYPVSETPVEIEAEYVTATGEDITLNDTTTVPLEIGLKGNTYQETTTGKQLFNVNGTLYTGSIEKVNNGFKLTNNSTYRTLSILLPNPIPAGTYKATYEMKNSTLSASNTVEISFRNSNGGLGSGRTSSTGETTITTTGEADRMYIYMLSSEASGTTVTLDNFMVSTTGGDYEPYTNGASPNPDYPQEVQVVTGDNTIKVQNKNIASLETSATKTIGGVSFTTDNGYININGTPTTNSNFSFDSFKTNSGSAVFSIEVTGYTDLTTGNGSILLQESTNNSTWTTISDRVLKSTSTHYQNVTLDNSKYYRIRFYCGSNNVFTNATIKIQLEYGNEKTDFTPYQSQEYEINLGKNLQQNNWENGRYNGSGVGTNVHLKINNGNMFQVGKIYTIHFKNTLGVTSSLYVQNTNDEINLGTFTYNSTTNISSLTITFTQQIINVLNGSSVRFACYRGTGITADDISEAMIEAGTTPTSYSPYFTPIELCKIGTYQDYLYKSGENWYKHTEIGKYIANNDLTNNGAITTTIPMLTPSISALGNSVDLLSNLMLEAGSGDTRLAGTTSSGKVRVYLSTTYASTMAEANTYLTNNNFTIYFPLSTPTEEQITNAELIEQLNAILNAVSYEDQTNISQENDNLPFILDVSALQKGTNEAIIDNEGNIYSKPIINIVGDGIVGVSLNGSQILSLDMTTYNDITIDTETMEAYDNNGLRNRQVTGNYNNLRLQPGENTISLNGGFTSATISKYKRWLWW